MDSNGEPMDTISMGPGMTQMMIQGPAGTEPQVLQVLSLKDATALTKAMQAMGDVKAEQAESILSDQWEYIASQMSDNITFFKRVVD